MTVQIRYFTSACTILQNSLVLMCNKNWYFFANKLGLPNKTSHEQGNNFLKTIHFYSCVMFSIFYLTLGFSKQFEKHIYCSMFVKQQHPCIHLRNSTCIYICYNQESEQWFLVNFGWGTTALQASPIFFCA